MHMYIQLNICKLFEQEKLNLEEASNFAEVTPVDFKRLIVMVNIHKLIKQLNYSQGIFICKPINSSYNQSIDFFPIDWREDLGECCIYFKFDYTNTCIKIQFQIGPLKWNLDKQQIRARVIQVMQKPEYSSLVRVKNLQEELRNSIYEKKITEINYKNDDINCIIRRIQSSWQDFIKNDYQPRVDIITTVFS